MFSNILKLLGFNFIFKLIININLNIYMLILDFYSIKKFIENFFILINVFFSLFLSNILSFIINLLKFIINDRILLKNNEKKKILAPSLNVYYPIKSAIFSVTIRITGGLLIFFLSIYFVINFFNIINNINYIFLYSLFLILIIALQIHQFNSLII